MKTIEKFITEKLHLTADNKNLKAENPDVKVVFDKLYNYIYSDFFNRRDNDSREVVMDWIAKNNVKRFKCYYNNGDHLGGGIDTTFGSIHYSMVMVDETIKKLNNSNSIFKCVYNNKGIVMSICDGILIITLPDTTFIVMKDK